MNDKRKLAVGILQRDLGITQAEAMWLVADILPREGILGIYEYIAAQRPELGVCRGPNDGMEQVEEMMEQDGHTANKEAR